MKPGTPVPCQLYNLDTGHFVYSETTDSLLWPSLGEARAYMRVHEEYRYEVFYRPDGLLDEDAEAQERGAYIRGMIAGYHSAQAKWEAAQHERH